MTPVVTSTPEDPRVQPSKCPDPFATTSARHTSSPKRKKSSSPPSKYSSQLSLPQASSSTVCRVNIPFLVIAVISFILALVQAILLEASFPHLRTALAFQLEDHAKNSGFSLLSICSHQEAFHEFDIDVSNASRANGSVPETHLNVQEVIWKILQVSKSDWRQFPSQVTQNECSLSSIESLCSTPPRPLPWLHLRSLGTSADGHSSSTRKPINV